MFVKPRGVAMLVEKEGLPGLYEGRGCRARRIEEVARLVEEKR